MGQESVRGTASSSSSPGPNVAPYQPSIRRVTPYDSTLRRIEEYFQRDNKKAAVESKGHEKAEAKRVNIFAGDTCYTAQEKLSKNCPSVLSVRKRSLDVYETSQMESYLLRTAPMK